MTAFRPQGCCVTLQAVSAKLDELAQTAPAERQSHLGETQHDADYQQPAAKPGKSSSAAVVSAKHKKSARVSAARKAKDDQEDESDEDGEKSVENDRVKMHDNAGSDVHDNRLSWPKRPSKNK